MHSVLYFMYLRQLCAYIRTFFLTFGVSVQAKGFLRDRGYFFSTNNLRLVGHFWTFGVSVQAKGSLRDLRYFSWTNNPRLVKFFIETTNEALTAKMLKL